MAGAGFTGPRAYLITHDGYLIVMDAKTGEVTESVYVNDTPGEMGMSIASPMIVGGRVYIGSETGGLRCYANGK